VAAEKLLVLSPSVKLNAETATQILAILARRGAGKSYLAGRIVEYLASINCPVIVLDTVGNWWGLTLAADGKSPGLPFLVIGGAHGALELQPEKGTAVARLVIEKNLSCVIDISRLRKSEMLDFVGDFSEAFYELIVKNPAARTFVAEEMQRVAPQTMSGHQEMRTFRSFQDLIRLGRNYGLGFIMLSQRPQSINKEILSQTEVLFAGQMVEAQGRKALDEWIVEHDMRLKDRYAEIASLGVGEFYCWSPGWLRVFEKIKCPPKWTYDASSTPKLGKDLLAAKPAMTGLTKEMLEEFRALLNPPEEAEPESAVVAYDEDALRVEQEARRAAQAQVSAMTHVTARVADQLHDLARQLEGVLDNLDSYAVEALEEPLDGQEEIDFEEEEPPPSPPRVPSKKAETKKTSQAPKDASGLGKCARAIMVVLIQAKGSLDKKRLARRAVYSPKTGGFNNALSELRTLHWIEGSGEIRVTAKGKQEYEAKYGRVPPLPTGRQLFDHWLSHPKMGKCDRAIMTALRQHGPMTKDQIAKVTDYSAGTGGFNNSLSNLRTLGIIEGKPKLALAPELIR
jgi:hypothetical protein